MVYRPGPGNGRPGRSRQHLHEWTGQNPPHPHVLPPAWGSSRHGQQHWVAWEMEVGETVGQPDGSGLRCLPTYSGPMVSVGADEMRYMATPL